MRKTVLATAFLATLSLTGAAHAEESPFSGNFSLTTDYVFRGISQTQGQPALQGGFDYAHSSGFYIGTWASNVGWVDDVVKKNNSMEIDLYLGYAGEAGPISYDVGAIRYFYPGTSYNGAPTPDSTEVYVALGWQFLELKYSHAVSKRLFAWASPTGKDSRNSNYLELNAAYGFGEGWEASAHIGRQVIKNFGRASYADWAVGVSKDVGFGTVALNYSDSDADGSCSAAIVTYCFGDEGGKNAAGDRFVLSFSKEF